MSRFGRIRIDWNSFDWASLGRGWTRDLRVAAGFFTRLPLPFEAQVEAADVAQALRAWPIIGFGIGLLGGLAYALVEGFGLDPLPSALLALLVTAAATGGFHEDGLADFADALGGRDPAARLAIMKDSRTGAYGTLALIFSVGLRAGALAEIADPGAVCAALAAAAAGSRGLAALLPLALEPARSEGLGAVLGGLPQEVGVAAAGLGALATVLLLGVGPGIAALALGIAAAAGTGALARERLGGYTGDVLGAAQQAAEIAILLAAAMLA